MQQVHHLKCVSPFPLIQFEFQSLVEYWKLLTTDHLLNNFWLRKCSVTLYKHVFYHLSTVFVLCCDNVCEYLFYFKIPMRTPGLHHSIFSKVGIREWVWVFNAIVCSFKVLSFLALENFACSCGVFELKKWKCGDKMSLKFIFFQSDWGLLQPVQWG